MSNKLKGTSPESSIHVRAVGDIQSVIAQSGVGVTNKDVARDIIGLESLSDDRLMPVQRTYKEVVVALKETGTFARVLSGFSAAQQEVALEAAAMTIMAGGDPAAWHVAAKAPDASGGAHVVNPNQGVLDYADNYALEGFEPASMNQFIAQSAYVNALAAIQGGFEETFFPIQIVPAGTNGVDVTITIPKIFSASSRSAKGTPATFNKTNIIKAIVDSSVLENNVTKVQPVATGLDLTSDPFLVADTVVTTTAVVIDGIAVNTRPLAVGLSADVIGVSQTAALLANGLMNETDTLDNTINVGKLYYTATIGAATANVAYDVSSQMGSLLQRAAENTDKGFITTFTAKVVLKKGFATVGGAGSAAAFETAMGANVEVMIGEVTITARANTEFGTMEVFANNPVWKKAYDVDGTEVPVPGSSSFAVVGYLPQARRTNANIRSRGTIVDSTTAVTYRFPVPLQSPIISQQTVSGAINTSIEGLAQAERIRNNNNAVNTLLALEEVLAPNNGLPVGSPAMGSEMVVPTYAYRELDMEAIVVRMASKDSLDDIRGALTASIMSVVNEMIQRSEYLAALEYYTGNNADYEVIVVTDSVIYPWLMEAGDARTLGAQTKFKITQTLNNSMKGRIYVSLRRQNRDGQLNPLDFGGFLYTPALTHEVQVSRGGATVKEIHTVPRNAYYATLPILGRIDVKNIVELFSVA